MKYRGTREEEGRVSRKPQLGSEKTEDEEQKQEQKAMLGLAVYKKIVYSNEEERERLKEYSRDHCKLKM